MGGQTKTSFSLIRAGSGSGKPGTLDLRCLDGHVRLRVRDDGVGFDPGSIPEREEPGRAGLGIFGMRERATLLRGTLEIHSSPLRGTEVVAQLPLEERHAS